MSSTTSAAFNRATCTIENCPISESSFHYQPSVPANGLFLFLFCICLADLVIHSFFSIRFLAWSITMLIGILMEIVGYICRIMGNHNPFNNQAYAAQYICLTIAPAFIAAGIYFCLSRIVETFGPSTSRLKPKSYPRIFISCDIISILLQAAGGGTASSAANRGKSPGVGNSIVIAGLVFQCITIALFSFLAIDYMIRTNRQVSRLGGQNALDPRHERLRNSRTFRLFLLSLAVSTVLIFLRCVYRVAEFSGGFNGPIMRNEHTFIALESAIVVTAVLLLSALHPHLAFQIVGPPRLPFRKITNYRDDEHALNDLNSHGAL